jgi:hypothetical protein
MKNDKMQQQINIDAAALPTMTCPQCKNYTFHASFIVKKLSALVSPSGKETIVPIQVFTCTACATILPLNEKGVEDMVKDVAPPKIETVN